MTGVTRNRKVYKAAIGLENPAAPGVPVTPTTGLRFAKFGLKPNITNGDLNLADGNPGSTFPYREKAEPNGAMEMPFWPEEGAEIFLKLAFGAATSTRNIPSTGLSYTHEFTQDWDNALSASVYRWAPGMTGVEEPEVWAGAVVKSLELSWNGPGPVDLKVDFDSIAPEYDVSLPSVTHTSAPPWFWGNMIAKIDGTQNAEITNLTLKIEREIDKQYGAQGDGNIAPNIFTPTNWKVTGGLKFPYRDWDELRTYLTGSSTGTVMSPDLPPDRTLQIINTGSTIETIYKYLTQFDMPRVSFETDADRDNDKTIDYDINYTAQKYTGVDAGLGTNKILSARMVSKLAAIA